MSICILNKEQDHCLPENIIKKIEIKILNKNTNINKIDKIELLAEKKNCNGETLQEKEVCILEKINDDESKKILLHHFKPVTKSFSKNHWITNTEIDSIQYQLSLEFKGYYYSNIHMIDLVMFDPNTAEHMNYKAKCIKDINFINEIKKTNNILTYNGELKNYGIVINTDTSKGHGLHWFSIFIDFKVDPITVEYFNSSGYDLENIKFKNYFENIIDDIKRDKDIKDCKWVQVTEIQHQRDDTANCGAYSLYYIWMRLKGKPYEYFSNHKIIDEDMADFREFLFRTKTKK